jgi:DNA-directed RNA polymerase beta' subunit
MSTEEIQRVAQLQVSSRVLFQMPDRRAAAHGCMDPRLGISDKMSHCKTCHKKLTDCAGHFGYIQLELPVFHAGYFKHTLTLLQCICKKCSRVLVSPQLRQQLLKRIATGNVDALARAALFKKVRARAASAHTHSVPPTSPLPPRTSRAGHRAVQALAHLPVLQLLQRRRQEGRRRLLEDCPREVPRQEHDRAGRHAEQVWPFDLCC